MSTKDKTETKLSIPTPALCIEAVINYYNGIAPSLDQISLICENSKAGTNFLNILEALKKLNFECGAYKLSIEDLISYNSPTILHVIDPDNLQHHFVLFLSYSGSKFHVFNPKFKHQEEWTQDKMEDLWMSKNCICAEPSGSFKTK